MTVQARCACGKRLQGSPRWAGRAVTCPACGDEVHFPASPLRFASLDDADSTPASPTTSASSSSSSPSLSARSASPEAGLLSAELSCPTCAHSYRLPAKFAGKQVECPHCATRFRVADDLSRLHPIPAAPPPAPAAVAAAARYAAPQRSRSWWWFLAGGVLACSLALVATLWSTGLLGTTSAVGPGTHEQGSAASGLHDLAPFADVDSPSSGTNSPPRAPAIPKPPDIDWGAKLVHVGTIPPDAIRSLELTIPAEALSQKTQLEADQLPLRQLLEQVARRHHVPLVIEEQPLAEEGISPATPVTYRAANIPLDEALVALLSTLQLTYIVEDGAIPALRITTLTAASKLKLTTFDPGKIQPKSPPARKKTK